MRTLNEPSTVSPPVMSPVASRGSEMVAGYSTPAIKAMAGHNAAPTVAARSENANTDATSMLCAGC